MSDVLIKNTKMPDCCNHCFYVRFCGPHALTVERLRESVHEQIFDVFGEIRLDGCPLVEVKPLVEKYRLYNYLENKYCEGCTKDCDGSCTVEKMLDDIDDFPTVAEASE